MVENIKCYLLLGFRDAALIVKNDYLSSKRNPTYTKSSMYKSGVSIYEEPDLEHPIGLNQLANALHVMCGLSPVPTKRKDESMRPEETTLSGWKMIRYCSSFRHVRMKHIWLKWQKIHILSMKICHLSESVIK